MNFAALLSYAFLTAISPGPNNILSMTNAGKYGFRRAFPFDLGVFSGALVVMGCCAAFSSLIYRVIPSIQPVMRCLGAAYLLWLAWSIWRDRPHKGKGPALQTNSYLAGLTLQFVNVKVILYGITAFSSFILPYYRDLLPVAGFVLLLACISFSCVCCWGLFGAVFQRVFQQHAKAVNLVMALMLVWCAWGMVAEVFAAL